jgi:hypothetical protein
MAYEDSTTRMTFQREVYNTCCLRSPQRAECLLPKQAVGWLRWLLVSNPGIKQDSAPLAGSAPP